MQKLLTFFSGQCPGNSFPGKHRLIIRLHRKQPDISVCPCRDDALSNRAERDAKNIPGMAVKTE